MLTLGALNSLLPSIRMLVPLETSLSFGKQYEKPNVIRIIQNLKNANKSNFLKECIRIGVETPWTWEDHEGSRSLIEFTFLSVFLFSTPKIFC